MIAECSECHEQAEVAYYPQYERKWLCGNCYELYEREDQAQNEPVPYPDADEIMEDQRLV